VKGSVKVKGTLLTVVEKLVLDGEPEVVRCTTAFPDHPVKIRRNGVADPVEDDAIHLNPFPGSLDRVLFVTCSIRA
jgi:hypothetical protein